MKQNQRERNFHVRRKRDFKVIWWTRNKKSKKKSKTVKRRKKSVAIKNVKEWKKESE